MSSTTGATIRTELLAVALVGAGLLLTEMAVRLNEVRLSRDLAHIRSLPQLAERIPANGEKTQGEQGVLVLGNSLVRYGIDEGLLERALCCDRRPARVVRVFPDASSIAEWHYYLQSYFLNRQRVPDVLIVPFATNQLEDQRGVAVCRIGAHCCTLTDTPAAFAQDILTFEDRASFLLSMGSAAYAQRDRIRKRALDGMVPYYQESATRANDVIYGAKRRGALPEPATYARLKRLLDVARERNIAVVLLAMPIRGGYRLDPQLQRLAEKRGVALLDLRSTITDAQAFFDDLHLTEDGARRFTRILGAELRRWRGLPAVADDDVAQGPLGRK